MSLRVALAHDFIRHGGAERVLEQLHEIWPEAPVYTLLAEKNPAYAGWDIRTSWLQRWVPAARYRWPLPYYPRLVERMMIREDVDLVVSSSVSWMKSLRAPAGVPHLCYIHRPMMFAYELQTDCLASYPPPLRPLLRRGPALVDQIREHADGQQLQRSRRQRHSRHVGQLTEGNF